MRNIHVAPLVLVCSGLAAAALLALRRDAASTAALRRLEARMSETASRAAQADERALTALSISAASNAERTHAAMETALSRITPAAVQETVPEEDPVRSPVLALASHEEALARARAYAGELDKALAAESRDAEWASHAEKTLSGLTGGLDHSSIIATYCKETLCRLQVRHDDSNASDQWLGTDGRSWEGLSHRITLREVESDGSVLTTTFAVRDGHRFPLRRE